MTEGAEQDENIPIDELTPEEASRIIHSHRKVRYGKSNIFFVVPMLHDTRTAFALNASQSAEQTLTDALPRHCMLAMSTEKGEMRQQAAM